MTIGLFSAKLSDLLFIYTQRMGNMQRSTADLSVNSIHDTTQQMKCFFNRLPTNENTFVLQKHHLKYTFTIATQFLM